MPDVSDMDLLREFARNHSETAFTELVRRHINLVYSVARRFTGDDGDAHDVTQAVFIILARKATRLRERTILTGWLYETTRFTATRQLRTNLRRQAREHQAYMQSTLTEADTTDAWQQLAPHLEDAMLQLSERDRTLVALRFYENQSGPETASLLGIREAAAHKRLERALIKLRKFFARRGVTLTVTAIAGAVSANSVHAAPEAMAQSISAVALAKGAVATTSTVTLANGALKLMAWAKAKTAILIGTGLLLAAGTTAVVTTAVVRASSNSSPDAIYEKLWASSETSNPDLDALMALLKKAPPALIIRPTRYPNSSGGAWGINLNKGFMVNLPVPLLLENVYGLKAGGTAFPDSIPAGDYDLMITTSGGTNEDALKSGIKKQFGLIAHKEVYATNVLVLTVKDPATLQSHLATSKSELVFGGWNLGGQDTVINFSLRNVQLDDVVLDLENLMGIPVINRTGLTNRYDFNFQTETAFSMERARQSVRGQLLQCGLQLLPSHEPIEMLVTEKVK